MKFNGMPAAVLLTHANLPIAISPRHYRSAVVSRFRDQQQQLDNGSGKGIVMRPGLRKLLRVIPQKQEHTRAP